MDTYTHTQTQTPMTWVDTHTHTHISLFWTSCSLHLYTNCTDIFLKKMLPYPPSSLAHTFSKWIENRMPRPVRRVAFLTFVEVECEKYAPDEWIKRLFRWQTNFVFDGVYQTCLSITCRVTDFFCADHHWANMYLRTAIVKLHGLSITDAPWCMPVRKAWAISRGENKVKLSSAASIAFERSSHSNDQRTPRIEQTQFENTSGPRFAKHDFRNKFLESQCLIAFRHKKISRLASELFLNEITIPRLYTRPPEDLRRLSQTKVWGKHEVTWL